MFGRVTHTRCSITCVSPIEILATINLYLCLLHASKILPLEINCLNWGRAFSNICVVSFMLLKMLLPDFNWDQACSNICVVVSWIVWVMTSTSGQFGNVATGHLAT